MSDKLMRFDPATGEEKPYPSHAKQWREWHGGLAWLFNPWTGERRQASCVGSDVTGLLIVPDGESIKAAPKPATVAVDAGALAELRLAFAEMPRRAYAVPSHAELMAEARVKAAVARLLAGGES